MMITYKELSSLTQDLGFNARALYMASNQTKKHYRKTKIPKSNGEERELFVPDAFLKLIQRRIVDCLLSREEVSPYATAYTYGGSTVKNARPHIGQPVILKLDIQHFFDSITYPLIKEKAFPSSKYSESNRILLALICSYRGTLPQGAPTSPYISNVIMRDFDNVVGAWCNERRIRYTRYCDDMTFSGNFDPGEVIRLVKDELKKLGFFLNGKKTTIVHNGQKKIITGIVVNEKPNVSAAYRKEIRQTVYYCQKYGVRSHMERREVRTDASAFLRKLLGQINYVLSVDPANFEFKQYKKWVISEAKKLKTQS